MKSDVTFLDNPFKFLWILPAIPNCQYFNELFGFSVGKQIVFYNFNPDVLNFSLFSDLWVFAY
jgi:hypothetical protein